MLLQWEKKTTKLTVQC